MPSNADGDDGGLFPNSDPDETRFVPGGRPIPPALRGQSEDEGVFGAPRSSGQPPAHSGAPLERDGGPLSNSFWDDEPETGHDPTRAQPQLLEEFWPDESEGFAPDEQRAGRRGGPLLFLIGMVAVVAAAVIFAALNALGVLGGDDADVAADVVGEADTAVDPGAEAANDQAAEGDLASGLEDQTGAQTDPGVVVDPNALGVELLEDPFVCDGEVRPFARLTNAAPNEQVAFVSPQSSGLRPGAADEAGAVTMRWQCEPSQAPTVWEIAATGATSARTVTFAFRGVVAGATEIMPDDAANPTEATVSPVPADGLTVVVDEDPFACDGETRPFARLSGAEPNEQIRFTSPESPNLRAGTADAEGALDVRWQCDADQVGTTWNLTATGDQSQRSVTFSVTGSAG